jgi:hypothetical protein
MNDTRKSQKEQRNDEIDDIPIWYRDKVRLSGHGKVAQNVRCLRQESFFY